VIAEKVLPQQILIVEFKLKGPLVNRKKLFIVSFKWLWISIFYVFGFVAA